MKISNVVVVSVPVKDAEVAKNFYCDTFGMVVTADQMMGPNMRWLEVAPEGSDTRLSFVSWYDNMSPGSVQGLCLETPDVQALHAELTAKGVTVSELINESFGTFFNVNDPDGNGLLIITSTPYGAA